MPLKRLNLGRQCLIAEPDETNAKRQQRRRKTTLFSHLKIEWFYRRTEPKKLQSLVRVTPA